MHLLALSLWALVACGREQASPPASPDPTAAAPAEAPAETRPAVGRPEPSAAVMSAPETCSAAGMDVSSVSDLAELSPRANQTRRALVTAAAACDVAALGRIAAENPEFSFSFGADADPAAFWSASETSGDTPMRDLVRVLSMTPLAEEPPEGGAAASYVWPRVHGEAPSPEAWAEFERVFGPTEAASARGDGYMGWRTAIDAEGRWLYYVAGD